MNYFKNYQNETQRHGVSKCRWKNNTKRAVAPCFGLATPRVQINLDFGLFPQENKASDEVPCPVENWYISLISKLDLVSRQPHTASFSKESRICGPKLEAFLPFCFPAAREYWLSCYTLSINQRVYSKINALGSALFLPAYGIVSLQTCSASSEYLFLLTKAIWLHFM